MSYDSIGVRCFLVLGVRKHGTSIVVAYLYSVEPYFAGFPPHSNKRYSRTSTAVAYLRNMQAYLFHVPPLYWYPYMVPYFLTLRTLDGEVDVGEDWTVRLDGWIAWEGQGVG